MQNDFSASYNEEISVKKQYIKIINYKLILINLANAQNCYPTMGASLGCNQQFLI